MKDKNAIEKFVDRAMEDDDFQDLADIIEKSVESAIYYSKLGAGALVRGVKKGLSQEDTTRLPVNRDPAKVNQKVATPNAWYWRRNADAFLAASSVFLAFSAFFGGIADGELLSDLFIAVVFFLAIAVVCAMRTVVTQRNMILARDFFRLRREIQDQSVLSTEDIVTALNKPKEEVLPELAQMIQKGFLPQGRLVENGELLLLDHAAYKAYKEHYAEKPLSARKETPSIEEESSTDDRAAAIDAYKATFESLNERSQDRTLKDKIVALLKLLDAIRHAVNTDPARVESLNKFVDYYTPTTIKLIERYLQFESSSVITDAIQATMQDILRSLDKVIDGYEKLLDGLYRDDLLDLNAEMDVMATVMKQDGLIEEDAKGDDHV